MRRRSFLALGASIGAVLAGCSGDSSGGDPESVVRDVFDSLQGGDNDAVNELIPTDAPAATVSDEQVLRLANANLTVDSLSVENQTTDRASVRVVYSLDQGQTGERGSVEQVFNLRQRDGSWIIWRVDTVSAPSPAPQPPQVLWEWDDSASDGTVTLTHGGGDHVEDPQRFTVQEAGGQAYGTLQELVGDTISAGNSGTVDVRNETGTLELVWTSPEGGTQLVSEHDYDVS